MQKKKVALTVGIIYAIVSMVFEYLQTSLSEINYQVSGFVFLVSIILLFKKEYRTVSKWFLAGFLGTLLGILIINLLSSIFLISINK